MRLDRYRFIAPKLSGCGGKLSPRTTSVNISNQPHTACRPSPRHPLPVRDAGAAAVRLDRYRFIAPKLSSCGGKLSPRTTSVNISNQPHTACRPSPRHPLPVRDAGAAAVRLDRYRFIAPKLSSCGGKLSPRTTSVNISNRTHTACRPSPRHPLPVRDAGAAAVRLDRYRFIAPKLSSCGGKLSPRTTSVNISNRTHTACRPSPRHPLPVRDAGAAAVRLDRYRFIAPKLSSCGGKLSPRTTSVNISNRTHTACRPSPRHPLPVRDAGAGAAAVRLDRARFIAILSFSCKHR